MASQLREAEVSRSYGQAGSPIPLQSMHVPLAASQYVPLSVHMLFGQQGPNALPHVLQVPAWQIVAGLPASRAPHSPPSATHTPLPGRV